MNKGGNRGAAKTNNTLINALVVVVIVVFVAAGVYATYGKLAQGVEDRAIASGEKAQTVGYLARQAGMSVEDYLAQYGLELSDTITKDTTESDMMDNMTLENYLKYNGDTQTPEEVLEGTGLTDVATKDTLWKDFLPQVPVVSIIGEETFEQIKAQYEFGDEVTADMPYGEFEELLKAKSEEASADASEEGSDDSSDTTDSEGASTETASDENADADQSADENAADETAAE